MYGFKLDKLVQRHPGKDYSTIGNGEFGHLLLVRNTWTSIIMFGVAENEFLSKSHLTSYITGVLAAIKHLVWTNVKTD